MTDEWYCCVDDEVLGPLSNDEVLAMAVAGNLAPTDLVRKEIDGRWVQARRLKGITFSDCRTDEQQTGSSLPRPPQPIPSIPEGSTESPRHNPVSKAHEGLPFIGCLVFAVLAFVVVDRIEVATGKLTLKRLEERREFFGGSLSASDMEELHDARRANIESLWTRVLKNKYLYFVSVWGGGAIGWHLFSSKQESGAGGL